MSLFSHFPFISPFFSPFLIFFHFAFAFVNVCFKDSNAAIVLSAHQLLTQGKLFSFFKMCDVKLCILRITNLDITVTNKTAEKMIWGQCY